MMACDESQQTTNQSNTSRLDMNTVDAYFSLDDLSMTINDQAVDIECQQDNPPLIMLHGFLAAGDTWSKHTKRLLDRGFCLSHLIVFDWNTLDRDLDHVSELDLLIDQTQNVYS